MSPGSTAGGRRTPSTDPPATVLALQVLLGLQAMAWLLPGGFIALIVAVFSELASDPVGERATAGGLAVAVVISGVCSLFATLSITSRKPGRSAGSLVLAVLSGTIASAVVISWGDGHFPVLWGYPVGLAAQVVVALLPPSLRWFRDTAPDSS